MWVDQKSDGVISFNIFMKLETEQATGLTRVVNDDDDDDDLPTYFFYSFRQFCSKLNSVYLFIFR